MQLRRAITILKNKTEIEIQIRKQVADFHRFAQRYGMDVKKHQIKKNGG